MAERSEPPRPRVIVSPSLVRAWNPVITATCPNAVAASTRAGSTERMRPSPHGPSATNPASSPLNERAGQPSAERAIASSAADCCSPVASSLSSSRLSVADGAVALASPRRSSVVFPMAETTTAVLRPCRAKEAIRRPAARIRSGVPTDEPPNLSTMPSPSFHTPADLPYAYKKTGGLRLRRPPAEAIAHAVLSADRSRRVAASHRHCTCEQNCCVDFFRIGHSAGTSFRIGLSWGG